MTWQQFLAFGAFAISMMTVAVNVWAFVRKRKQENRDLAALATKAVAERDSIVVKGAEGAIIIMERMLATATAEAEKLRARIIQLETENADKERRLREAERRIAELERSALRPDQ